MMKKLQYIIIFLLLISILTSCNLFLGIVGNITNKELIEVTPVNNSTYVGRTIQYKAFLTYQDSENKDITTMAQWSTSNANVATISNEGIVSTVGIGTVTITAAYNVNSGSGELIVSNSLPSSTPTPPPSNPINWYVRADYINREATCYSSFISGNYLYIGTGGSGSGMKIYNISDPLKPMLINSINLSDAAVSLVVAGNYAYIANASAGLVIVDVSVPSSPQIMKTVSAGYANGIFVSGNYAYVADNSSLIIVNITTPPTAGIIGTHSTGNTNYDVVVNGTYAYLAQENGLEIIDIANPAAPVDVTTLTTSLSGTNQAVAINGNYAYVANTTSNTLKVVDITNPPSASMVNSIAAAGGYGIAVNNTTGYIAAGDGVIFLDLSNPQTPVINTSVNTYAVSRCITLHGNYAYVANENFGITTMDISLAPPTYGQIVKSTPIADTACQVVIAGNYGYVADNRGGLQIINNVLTPGNARLINTIKVPDYAVDVAVNENYAYVAAKLEPGFPDVPDLQIFNITNPLNVYAVGSLSVTGTAYSIEYSGNYILLGTDSGLSIINVSNPANPVPAGSISTGVIVYDIKADGDYAYLAGYGSGLLIARIFNTGTPSIVHSVAATSYVYAVAAGNGYCYMADYNYGLQVVDISVPTTASIIGSYGISGTTRGVAVQDNYVYLTDTNTGIQVLDVSTPSTPSSIKTISTPVEANAVVANQWFGYAAAGTYGLLILGE